MVVRVIIDQNDPIGAYKYLLTAFLNVASVEILLRPLLFGDYMINNIVIARQPWEELSMYNDVDNVIEHLQQMTQGANIILIESPTISPILKHLLSKLTNVKYVKSSNEVKLYLYTNIRQLTYEPLRIQIEPQECLYKMLHLLYGISEQVSKDVSKKFHNSMPIFIDMLRNNKDTFRRFINDLDNDVIERIIETFTYYG